MGGSLVFWYSTIQKIRISKCFFFTQSWQNAFKKLVKRHRKDIYNFTNIHFVNCSFELFKQWIKKKYSRIIRNALKHHISILEWFQMHHVTLEKWLLKFQLCITGINYILKYIAIENSHFKLYQYFTILQIILLFLFFITCMQSWWAWDLKKRFYWTQVKLVYNIYFKTWNLLTCQQ